MLLLKWKRKLKVNTRLCPEVSLSFIYPIATRLNFSARFLPCAGRLNHGKNPNPSEIHFTSVLPKTNQRPVSPESLHISNPRVENVLLKPILVLRQKLYNAGLLICCSLVTIGNVQKGAGSGTKNVINNNAIISQQSDVTRSGFDLNPMALLFAKDYLKKNTSDLEQLKKRSRSKLHIINTVFSKYNIPLELKYMAIVESNLDADTVCNSTGATGIWQLMPVTACELGLKITDEVDERLQVYKSSTAAAKYLKQLYAEFGDWLLVIAAYNSGPAKVSRAINLSGYRDFWQLQNFLPAETRNHVKRFLSTLYFFEEQYKASIEQNSK